MIVRGYMIGISRRRRGFAALEHVLATVVFFGMACLAMVKCFGLMAMLHHVISTLVGWPLL
ncbi:hypothetical protein GC170_12960 [bacterium]|nr:hypothetical protein [bacterium]